MGRKNYYRRKNTKNRPRSGRYEKGFTPGKTVQVEVSGLAYGGYGIAKGPDGVVFVHRGVPGDDIKVQITRGKKNYGSGIIEELVKPSVLRTDSGCESFEQGCGGCQWLHISYSAQTEWKERIVRDTLKRIGGISCRVNPVLPLREPYGYRNKLSLQVRAKEGLCGFMLENSHKIINFSNCRCAMEPCLEAYKYVSSAVERGYFPHSVDQVHVRATRSGKWGVCFYGEQPSKRITDFALRLAMDNKNCMGVGLFSRRGYKDLCGQPYIEEELAGIKHCIPHNGFFQTNYIQAEQLLQLTRDYLEPGPKDSLLDVFCGSGFFALDLAGSCRRVLGIENNDSSIRYAVKNSKLNNIKNAEFISSDAARAMKRLKKGEWSTVVLDPPRTGCGPEVIMELARINPAKMVYVSCAPDTLARDLKLLSEYGYRVDFCQPVDMFPHTYHVEVVTGIVRK